MVPCSCGSKIHAMVPIKCVHLFLNATTFWGVSAKTHLVSIKTSQQIHCIVLKEQFDMCFLAKMYILHHCKQSLLLRYMSCTEHN